jgi:hypothetical protein
VTWEEAPESTIQSGCSKPEFAMYAAWSIAAWSKEFGMAGWYDDGAYGGADDGSDPGNITW